MKLISNKYRYYLKEFKEIENSINNYENILKEAESYDSSFYTQENQNAVDKLVMNYRSASRTYAKQQANLDIRKGLVYLPLKDAVRQFCDQKSKMTIDEFMLSINDYRTPTIIHDALYGYDRYGELNNFNRCVNKQDYRIREQLAAIRDEVIEHIKKTVFNLKRGHNTELLLVNELRNRINVDELYMMTNVYLGRSEHDIIMVCSKGVFTIEIKDHIAQMYWSKNGDFKEVAYGRVYDKVKDPYKQTITHEKEFNQMFNKELIRGVVLLGNNDAEYKCENDLIAKRVFKVDEFTNAINDLPNLLTHEQIEQILYGIKKSRIYKEPKFDFCDITKIDNLFIKVIDDLCLDVHKTYKVREDFMKFYKYKYRANSFRDVRTSYRFIELKSKDIAKLKRPPVSFDKLWLVILGCVYLYFLGGRLPYDYFIIMGGSFVYFFTKVLLWVSFQSKKSDILNKIDNFFKHTKKPFEVISIA